MKVSELISALERFVKNFGDREVEFLMNNYSEDSELVYFDEIHDGYNSIDSDFHCQQECVCEIRLKEED